MEMPISSSRSLKSISVPKRRNNVPDTSKNQLVIKLNHIMKLETFDILFLMFFKVIRSFDIDRFFINRWVVV